MEDISDKTKNENKDLSSFDASKTDISEELKAQNQKLFYEKIEEWKKYFNSADFQGPQVF